MSAGCPFTPYTIRNIVPNSRDNAYIKLIEYNTFHVINQACPHLTDSIHLSSNSLRHTL